MGDAGAVHTGQLVLNPAYTPVGGRVTVSAPSATEAVKLALAGTITVAFAGQTTDYAYGPAAVGTSFDEHRPFVVRDASSASAGGPSSGAGSGSFMTESGPVMTTAGSSFDLLFEDLAGRPECDYDYNDHGWYGISVNPYTPTAAVNLVADNNVDGLFNADDDALEDDQIGKLVFDNSDDDNGDSVKDYQTQGAVAGEDDLAEVRLVVSPGQDGRAVRLSVDGDATALRLWAHPDRTGPLSSVNTYVIGQDAVPAAVYVEGLGVGLATLHLELLGAGGAVCLTQAGPVKDDANARLTPFELDVNDNYLVTDAVDGFANYLPGYRGATPVLSPGMYNALTPLQPQLLHGIFSGLGSDVGVTRVTGQLSGVSSNKGCAGNVPDPADGFFSNEDDVSFKSGSQDRTVDTAGNPGGGGVNADKSWVNFYVRDYAATATITCSVWTAARIRGTYGNPVVWDKDRDGMQDKWELAAVTAFEAEHGYGFATNNKLTIFGAGEPEVVANEPEQPGPNMTAHKTRGDSLTPFQEYRGFVLDGGGFDGAGANGHAGGHKRLNPTDKELLLEVDAMGGVAAMPTPAQLAGVLADVSKGYSNATAGAGVKVYWVVDEAAAPAVQFAGTPRARTWATSHRNDALKSSFVHVMFVDHDTVNLVRGYTSEGGSYVDKNGCFVYTTDVLADNKNAGQYLAELANTAAHELCHAIIDPRGQGGFDGGEHLPNTDGQGNKLQAGDPRLSYLMVDGAFRTPRNLILFDDLTRVQIDLTRKTSVET